MAVAGRLAQVCKSRGCIDERHHLDLAGLGFASMSRASDPKGAHMPSSACVFFGLHGHAQVSDRKPLASP